MHKVLVALFVLLGASVATIVEANRREVVVHTYLIIGNEATRDGGHEEPQGGVFLGALDGLIGVESATLMTSDDEKVSFFGFSSQRATISDFWGVIRPVVSFGILSETAGGRIGVDFLPLAKSVHDPFNASVGVSYWMGANGFRISTLQVGFGF
ncbi:MAG: hypothetical protein A3D67_03720 [Candidatus Lloydbacteria bacterium RIFCSPHIGHO2_02_FULL_51_22]|uniref:Uncharacterized protein n=3 Tax=Candidatus Lloydiibacteriota TaxID=1817910 RepID=A0A1G2DA16_9BACT|nr:MAG: hypothetical protein A3D67_03720 [Candidatus Lloydbacteria bacterium RIFCSPHIGHO2_02_FULL_51_22]OGZ14111.1 MAG: hypothetical protein A3J08_02120 [Candidatus Lloydbacteria bacterium RIFCSPLOWO2_02_FULL_51_11]OGZ16921.1 MAG: hypothetical protein A3G11_00380 [Candidatus Lloydbacteria bacterium RIFCSPLOWO2_12_FULL_51_9]